MNQVFADAPRHLRVISVSEMCAIGEISGCIAVVWHQQPSPDAFRARNEQLLNIAQRAPGKCALVEIVEPQAKPPSQETRRVAMEVFKQLGPDLSAIGFVLEGSEMRSAFIRAMLTGMMFFVKQLQPTKVFKHVDDMADWVGPRVHAADPSFKSDLATAFEYLRRLTPSHAAATQ